MADYTCEQFLELDQERKRGPLTTRDNPASSSSPGLINFDFNFCWKSRISEWFIREDSSGEPQLLRSFHLPKIRKHIRLDQVELSGVESVRDIIEEEMELWGVWAESRQRLIKFAIDKAWEVAKSMPASHNTVHLNIRATWIHKHFFDESRDVRSAMQRSMEEEGYHLVPAADSSIAALESRKIILISEDSKTCSICLEEFPEGCEAICMPCSHVFHEDCIKKWLRTSHYCPLCRFEMPTNC